MTFKNLPILIIMLALVIPLALATPVRSATSSINRNKANSADRLSLPDPERDLSSVDVLFQGEMEENKERFMSHLNWSEKSDRLTEFQAGGKQSKNACFISGRIYGIERQTERSIYVVVIDPNTLNALAMFRAFRKEHDQPNYEFSLMRPGRYLLSVFYDRAGTLMAFRTRPSERLINCSRASQIRDLDFELH